MKLDLLFCVFTTCLGWLFGGQDLQGAISGLTIGVGILLICGIFL